MRYQIYLNKKTSDIVNRMAEYEKQKPATFIKNTLEYLIKSLEKVWEEEDKKTDGNE